MEINVELFKEQYRLIEQKLRQFADVKHSDLLKYAYIESMTCDDDVLYVDYYDNGIVRRSVEWFLFSLSNEELKEYYKEQYYRELERQKQIEQIKEERQERLEYERLKAKFEK